jgi:hypothetical protein
MERRIDSTRIDDNDEDEGKEEEFETMIFD